MIPATTSRFLGSSCLRPQIKPATPLPSTAPHLSYKYGNSTRTTAVKGAGRRLNPAPSAARRAVWYDSGRGRGTPGPATCSGAARDTTVDGAAVHISAVRAATCGPGFAASGGAGGGGVLGGPNRYSSIVLLTTAVPAITTAAALTASLSSMTPSADETASAAAAGAAELWSEIVRVYDKAQASGACSKTDTQVEVCPDATLGVDFVLRVASALKAKPQGPPPSNPQTTTSNNATATAPTGAPFPASVPAPTWRNPFLPPEPELFVRQLGSDHNLVLNKFNVVAHHVLVTTREFRSQAEPLYGSDLTATLEVLRAMPYGGVAFYNCGPYSGRSQPHKHLQVVPLPFMDGKPPLAPVDSLVGSAAAAAADSQGGGPTTLKPLAVRKAPYRCYVSFLPDSPTPQQLEYAFNELLQLCHPGYSYVPPLQLDGPPRNVATDAAAAAGSVSYNVVMTQRWLMLVPRSAERCGPLAPNSLAFAGTMLVRSEDELKYVRQTGPAAILASIGVPW